MNEHEEFHEAPRYASLQDYQRVLRERWRLIVLLGVIVGAAAFAYAAARPAEYEASTRLNAPDQARVLSVIEAAPQFPDNPAIRTAELAAIAGQESIAEATSNALDGELSTTEVQDNVEIAIDVQSNLMVVTATAESPKLAASLANEYGDEVVREATRRQHHQISAALDLVRKQNESAGANTEAESLQAFLLGERTRNLEAAQQLAEPAEVVSVATAPADPVAPNAVRSTILGLLCGLFVGVIAAFARDTLDTRLKAPRELEEQFGVPRVGQLGGAAFSRSIISRNGVSPLRPIDLEAARIMRTNLEAITSDEEIRSYAVTSALPGEGKSTLLVECDLRQPVVANRLGLAPSPGLSDILTGSASPQDVLQVFDIEQAGGDNGAAPPGRNPFVCVTAGTPKPNPAELLASRRFAQAFEKMSRAYDVVILDTSPLLSVVDTRELLALVDGVLVCGRSYQTTREQAKAVREVLDQFPNVFRGLVVTGIRPKDDDYSAYFYQYSGARLV